MRQRMNTFEVRQHLLLAAFTHAPFLFLATMERDDEVILATAAQRIMHEVAMRTGPHHRRIDLQVLRHIFYVNDGAIHDMPGHAMLVADQCVAYRRLHAIAADHRIRVIPLAVLIDDCYAAGVLVELAHLCVGAELDQRMIFHGFENRQMNVGPMNHRIRIAKACTIRRADVDPHHFLCVKRIHQFQVVRKYSAVARCLTDAQRIECVKRIGGQLDPCTDLPNLRGLLEQLHANTLTRERQRRGQATNAAADHKHVPVLAVCLIHDCLHYHAAYALWR
jgi:hypothetical protein